MHFNFRRLSILSSGMQHLHEILVWNARAHGDGVTFAQEWDADYEGLDVLKRTLAESNSKEPLGQGRCTGFGGGIKAFKVKKSDCEGEQCEQKLAAKAVHKLERKAMDFDTLESAPQLLP